MAQMRAGDPDRFVVTARRQSGGRGRSGRAWESPPGNLYASFALRDPAPMSVVPQLGFVAGVALGHTLRARLGGDPQLQLKWPNDALFGGAKLAGILLESAALPGGGTGCVIGIGVNCASHPDGLTYPTTDLAAAGDRDPRPDALLADLAVQLARELERWDGGAGFTAVRHRWLDLAAGLGEPIRVRLPSEVRTGIFRDLDDTGRLLLETAGGLTAVAAGDVNLSVPARAMQGKSTLRSAPECLLEGMKEDD